MSLDLEQFRWLTFDCYGTLIDWETGIKSALRSILDGHPVQITDEALLDLYGRLEAEIEAGPYRPYREVLAEVATRIGRQLGLALTEKEVQRLPGSLPNWKPFPDTVEALAVLKRHYQLAILSNTDDDLFAETAKRLVVPFDAVITAQQVRSYKPDRRNFETALTRLGVARDHLLHVAQSLFHDLVPARELKIAHVWVNRSGGRIGAMTGFRPDLEVPDLATLATLVEAA